MQHSPSIYGPHGPSLFFGTSKGMQSPEIGTTAQLDKRDSLQGSPIAYDFRGKAPISEFRSSSDLSETDQGYTTRQKHTFKNMLHSVLQSKTRKIKAQGVDKSNIDCSGNFQCMGRFIPQLSAWWPLNRSRKRQRSNAELKSKIGRPILSPGVNGFERRSFMERDVGHLTSVADV